MCNLQPTSKKYEMCMQEMVKDTPEICCGLYEQVQHKKSSIVVEALMCSRTIINSVSYRQT